jgi:hypothetical protein
MIIIPLHALSDDLFSARGTPFPLVGRWAEGRVILGDLDGRGCCCTYYPEEVGSNFKIKKV